LLRSVNETAFCFCQQLKQVICDFYGIQIAHYIGRVFILNETCLEQTGFKPLSVNADSVH